MSPRPTMPNPTSPVEPPSHPRRIVVVGTSGSGKSTLARRIAHRLGVPHVELDALHWGPDWTEVDPQTLRARIAQASSGDGWVLDGNYGAHRDLSWPRAQVVVLLDYPLPLILWRLLGRTLRRCLSGEVLWAGNRESLRKAFFSSDSILLWALKTWRKNRRTLPARVKEMPHLELVHARRPADVERWLAGLGPAGG